MKREISSFLTFYLRIILPGVSLIGAVVTPVAFYFGSDAPNPFAYSLTVSLLLLLFAVIISLLSYRYKKVAIDGDNLLVSNYRKVISVPLSDVENVTELRSRGHPVTIHLKSASKFGHKVTFLAKSRSIVGVLKKLAGIENVEASG